MTPEARTVEALKTLEYVDREAKQLDRLRTHGLTPIYMLQDLLLECSDGIGCKDPRHDRIAGLIAHVLGHTPPRR